MLSHPRIIRPAAALRRDPGDVLVGILDIARLAVHAVLRVDLVLRAPGGVLQPFIDAGRAVALAEPGEDVVLR